MVALGSLLCSQSCNAGIDVKEQGHIERSDIEYTNFLPTIEGFLKELRSGSIEKAYKDYTTDSFRNQISLEDFTKLVAKFKQLSNNKIFRYSSFYVENGVATFQGDMVSAEGSAIPVEFDIIKENGVWKILGMDLFQSEPAIAPR